MSNGLSKQGIRAQQRTSLDRLVEMEKYLGKLTGAVNQQGQQLNVTNEVLNAIVELFGAKEVQDRVEENRRKAAEAQAESERANVATLVTEGRLVVTETVEADAFLVGREFEKDVLVHPGRVQFAVAQIKPEHQEALKGKSVGYSFEVTPGGRRFEVVEIYRVVPAAEVKPVAPEESSHFKRRDGAVHVEMCEAEACKGSCTISTVPDAISGTVDQQPVSA